MQGLRRYKLLHIVLEQAHVTAPINHMICEYLALVCFASTHIIST
jgi:hypothetical protein